MEEADEGSLPNYYKLHLDTWTAINAALPPIQAAKVLYALERLFFCGEEPEEGSLPKPAQGLFDIQKQLVLGYRRNALNGSKNRKTTQKPSEKTTQKPTQFSTQETTKESGQFFEGSDSSLPAETQKVGGKHSGKHPSKSACDNTKQETVNIIEPTPSPPTPLDPALLPSAEQSRVVDQPHKQESTSDALQVVTESDPARAAAGAGLGRPAAALPSRAEYERVQRMLEEGHYEELTPEDRRVYQEGHKAYAAQGIVPE